MQSYGRKIRAFGGSLTKVGVERLAIAVRPPTPLAYGHLKPLPYWDPLRGDPRFEKIVASLAPK